MLRRLIMGRSAKESRAMAKRERAERAERQSRLRCDHPCHSCDYFAEVYRLAYDQRFREDVSDLLSDHVWACRSGEPNSSSCVKPGR